MKRKMIIFEILCVLLCSILKCHGQSPCPGFFRYLRDDRTQEIYGRIEIPHVPRDVALHLRVSFSIMTALPTQYVGKLELARSRVDTVKAIEQGLPIIYNVFFPVARPVPQLTEMKFNDRQYCLGQRVHGPVVTNIFLEHFLYPPGVVALSNDRARSIFSSSTTEKSNSFILIDDGDTFAFNVIPSITSRPSVPSFTSTTEKNDHLRLGKTKSSETCGKPGEPINYLIAKGQKTWAGQWPWLVAIFITRKKFEFQCAGSLITDKHVLTAAHCRRANSQELPANNFLVSVNRYDLDNWREENVQNSEVTEIRIHPEYKNHESAHADLALFVLREKLKMNSVIQPLCLWSGPTNLETIVGHSGYVVGWGRDESGSQYLAEPRVAQVPIVSQEDCLRSNIGFISSTSNKTFCAGRRDGSGPCNGDSGSALAILNPLSGKYHLRGIVSLSLLDRETLSCDLTQYIVYVDAAKYVDWIEAEISAT